VPQQLVRPDPAGLLRHEPGGVQRAQRILRHDEKLQPLLGGNSRVIAARVYSGIHFRIADAQGAVIGKKVANWREKHFFQPASR
jgi:hypothetical protein